MTSSLREVSKADTSPFTLTRIDVEGLSDSKICVFGFEIKNMKSVGILGSPTEDDIKHINKVAYECKGWGNVEPVPHNPAYIGWLTWFSGTARNYHVLHDGNMDGFPLVWHVTSDWLAYYIDDHSGGTAFPHAEQQHGITLID